MLSDGNARLAAARKLVKRSERRVRRLFLAEGAPSVREALASAAHNPGRVRELFVSDPDHPLTEIARAAGIRVDLVSEKAAASLSETSSPQGIVAVCEVVDVELADVLAQGPRLIAVLVDTSDPGNAGTILRTADAAGADAVVFAGGGVDPYGGKAVRASAGSLFHLPVVINADTTSILAALRDAGLALMATTGSGAETLFDVECELSAPHAWLFGNEAHGLDSASLGAAHHTVRIPIRGAAESLNLAAAAAVCLYASVRAAAGTPHEDGPPAG